MNRSLAISLSTILLVGTLIFGICSPASSAPKQQPVKPIELKFSYQTPPVAWTTKQFLDPWAKKVEKATQGKLKITQYPAQTLHAQTETLEATEGGITDISWLFPGYYRGRFPLSSVVELPLITLSSGKINGQTVAAAEINSYIFQELYESSPEIQKEWSRVKVLFLLQSSPQVIFTTKKPVSTIDDLNGLKIRALAGPTTEYVKAIGAAPVTVAAPDLYSSLERGVLDGLVWAWAGVDSYKLQEILHYWTDQPIISGTTAMIMNLDKWNSLPPDIQAAIMSVSGKYGARFSGQTAWGPAEVENVLKKAKQGGFDFAKITLKAGEQDKFVKAAKPIWDKWLSNAESKGVPGGKILNQLLQIQGKYRIP